MNIIVLHTASGDIPAIVPDASKIRVNHTTVSIKGRCEFLENNHNVMVDLGKLLVEVGYEIYNVRPAIAEVAEEVKND